MNVMIALMLSFGGYITINEIKGISNIVSDVELSDSTTEEFQDSLKLTDPNSGQPFDLQEDGGWIVSILDFIELIPLIGNIVGILRILFTLLYYGAFGSAILALKIGMSNDIVLAISTLMYVVYAIGLYGFVKDFLAARGSGT